MDKEEIKERWTEYCSELYTDKDTINQERVEELEKISPPPRDDEDEYILLEEVEAAVKRMPMNKSPGADEITAEMIKAGGCDLIKQIHDACNTVWKEGKVPEEWTKAMLETLQNKGDLTECKNYRTIALTSHMEKILMSILLNRLKVQTEEYMADEQAGFRRDRSTIQQILLLRLIAEKASRNSKIVYNCFVDFQKAFDSIKLDIIWATLRSYGVGKRLVQILRDMGERSKMAVKVGQEVGEWFTTTIGTRQGDPISPNIFITYLERVMDVIQDNGTGISVQGEMINNLLFADDIDLLEESCVALQNSDNLLSEAGIDARLRINIEMTKTTIFGKEDIEQQIEILNSRIENVKDCISWKCCVWDNIYKSFIRFVKQRNNSK